MPGGGADSHVITMIAHVQRPNEVPPCCSTTTARVIHPTHRFDTKRSPVLILHMTQFTLWAPLNFQSATSALCCALYIHPTTRPLPTSFQARQARRAGSRSTTIRHACTTTSASCCALYIHPTRPLSTSLPVCSPETLDCTGTSPHSISAFVLKERCSASSLALRSRLTST